MGEDAYPGICSVDLHRVLLNALRIQDYSKFENILKNRNVDLDKPFGDPEYRSLLDICCMGEGNGKYVRALLNHGANPNLINSTRKKAPIHFAINEGNTECVEILLAHKGLEINIQDNTGNTPLHYAVMKNIDQIATTILEKNNVDVNILNRKGKSPLHIALERNNTPLILKLINHANIDLGITNPDGSTLYELIANEHPDLEENLRLVKAKNTTNTSQLFELLRQQEYEVFIKKISNNKDKLNDNDGLHTFLQYCCDFGLAQVAEKLLSLGADPNTTHPANLRLPVMLAAYKGFVAIVKLFTDNKNTCYGPVNQETVLHCVMLGVNEHSGLAEIDLERNHFKCLTILLENVPGSVLDINCRDSKGNTALHYAAKQMEHKMVISLLNAGAYIGILNNFNEPACSDISFKTFQSYLDKCVYTNNKMVREDSFTIIFNYKCLIPFESKNLKLSKQNSLSLENMIEFGDKRENTNEVMYNCESDPLLYISKSKELKPLLKHPIFTSFLNLKWSKMRPYFFLNLFIYLLFCGFLTYYILIDYSYSSSSTNGSMNNISSSTNNTIVESKYFIVYLLAVLFLIIVMSREFFQLVISPLSYVLNPENWLEISIISVSLTILFCDNCIKHKHEISAIAILLLWTELVLLIGKHPALSTNIEMLKTVTWNFLKFLAWYSILILAFALSFHTLFKDSVEKENAFEYPGISIFKTIVMLTGEFDAGEIPFVEYPITSHFLFILFVFLIAIVLFNLLNGLAVSDTQAIKSDAELVAYISRVKLVSYIEKTLSNPAIFSNMGTQRNPICCCLQNSLFKRKRLFNRQVSKRINLFQDSTNEFEIKIFPNLRNKIVVTNHKSNRMNSANNVSSSCFDEFLMVSMDPAIVHEAKVILEKKQLEELQVKNNKKIKEKEELLSHLILECSAHLKESKKILTCVNELLLSFNVNKL